MNMHSQIKTARFGAGSVIIRANGNDGIPLDDIARLTPSVVAEEAHSSRSERYTYIPTSEVLKGLIGEGFRPFEVRQGGSRDPVKRQFTKHLIRLRHASQSAVQVGRHGDLIVPEIVMLNSHDGTSSYQFSAGAFRFICTNGLMAGDIFEHFKVAHKGDIVDGVIDATYRVIAEFPELIDSANQMAGTELSPREQLAFARAAAQLRWTPDAETNTERSPIDASVLLAARRSADQGNDLWRTFNRVQEGIIRGGQGYVIPANDNRRRQFRRVGEVRNIDQDRALNRALWTLAQEMEAIKQAA